MRSDPLLLALRELRLPLVTLICVYAVAIFGLTLIPGQDHSANTVYLTFFEAFYFVSFMSTTIGFGEIPYAFTNAQRLWVIGCIYTSVIAWLYAIGAVFRLFQDPTFQQALAERILRRAMTRVNEPFYIVCGYGETGRLLVKGLGELNTLAIAIDISDKALNTIKLSDLSPLPISVSADATSPEVLKRAGVEHKMCEGVLAVTGDDHTNLNIAVAVKLLRADLNVICRSEVDTEGDNMRSFGKNVIINPFESFALRLEQLVADVNQYTLHSWLVDQHGAESLNLEIAEHGLPTGNWIVCGYGRLGKVITKMLNKRGIKVQVIDDQPEQNGAPKNTIQGRGTEEATLLEADIHHADVLVAASDDDANNLSVLLTAKDVNPQLYTIGRVNQENKAPLYENAFCDYLMRHSRLIANKALTLISRPLVNDFLHLTHLTPDNQGVTNMHTSGERESAGLPHFDFANTVALIKSISNNHAPATTRISVDAENAPGLLAQINMYPENYPNGIPINKLLSHDAEGNPNEIPLLLTQCKTNQTTGTSRRANQLTPEPTATVRAGDQLLLCHRRERPVRALELAHNLELADTILGENPRYIPLFRWLRRRTSYKPSS